jgi:hypothetical protein
MVLYDQQELPADNSQKDTWITWSDDDLEAG